MRFSRKQSTLFSSTTERGSVVLLFWAVLYIACFAVYSAIPPVRNVENTRFFLAVFVLHSFLGFVLVQIWRKTFFAADKSSASKKKSVFGITVPFAIFFIPRLLVFPMQPWLSDDAWRYLWDGKLLANGINPYVFPPEAVELSTFRLANSELFSRLDYRSMSTIYPPLAQYVFALAALIGGGFSADAGYMTAYWIWKLLLLLSESLAIWLVWKAIKGEADAKQQALTTLLWYFCLPMTALECIGQAHVDGLLLAPIGMLLFGLKHLNNSTKEPYKLKTLGIFGGLVAIVGAIKIIPVVLGLPIFVGLKRMEQRLVFLGVALLVSLPIWLPLFHTEQVLTTFLKHAEFTTQAFQFNGGVYYALCYVLTWLGVANFWLFAPSWLAYLRIASVLIIGLFPWFREYFYATNFTRHRTATTFGVHLTPFDARVKLLLGTLAAALLVSAKVHTWYFLPLLLLNAAVSWKWLPVLAAGSMLSYAYYAVSPPQEQYSLEIVVWGIGLAAALWEMIKPRDEKFGR